MNFSGGYRVVAGNWRRLQARVADWRGVWAKWTAGWGCEVRWWGWWQAGWGWWGCRGCEIWWWGWCWGAEWYGCAVAGKFDWGR